MIIKKENMLLVEGYNNLSSSGIYDKMMENSDWPDIIKPVEDTILYGVSKDSVLLCLGSGTGRCVNNLVSKCKVIGYDISPKSVELARQRYPEAEFRVEDMMEIHHDESSIDVIMLPFSIFHVPREYHLQLLKNLYFFLKDDGYLFLINGVTDEPHFMLNFCGQILPYSHYDSETNSLMCREAGFHIVRDTIETCNEDDREYSFQFIEAIANKSLTND